MISGSFNKLMNQYGDEEQARLAAEAREIARRKKVAKIKRGIFYLVLAGIGVAGWMQRDWVTAKGKEVWASTFGMTETVTKHGEDTKNKAKELGENADKRNAIIDDILK